jgi:heme/copper-type cytochrome/quinol oxidase subunit 3
MTGRPSLDVSSLPTVVFGPRTTLWLGFVGVIIVEGMMILLTIVGYFYLRARAMDWPPGATPPPMAAATANTVLFVISTLPAAWLKRAAERGDGERVRTWLLVLSFGAVTAIGLSGWAFASLNVRWDTDAYGSLVWMLLGTEVVVLLAAALEIWVLTAYLFWGTREGRRFVNAYHAADYWLLAAVLWLATWAVIYVAPRVL